VTHQRTPQIHHGFRTIRCSACIDHTQCTRLLRSQNSERGRKIPRTPERQKRDDTSRARRTTKQKQKHKKPNKHTISFLLLLRLLFF
jgi:hypothetical protein